MPDLYESKSFIRKFIIRITFIFCFFARLILKSKFRLKRKIGSCGIFFISQNFYSSYCFCINQGIFLSGPTRLKLTNFIFRFLVTGVPQVSKSLCLELRFLVSILIELDAVIKNIILLSRIKLKIRKLFRIFLIGSQ